jgi:hypothetical protein
MKACSAVLDDDAMKENENPNAKLSSTPQVT